ncbi:RusA family crossover junction endodeoxyribonuclease [Dickeya oryzae]|uniref:Crossover junction endodeoxyribonuclease rusA n=1 Tax=Dickeya oryzae TaxID=1240404 RepID=A0ABS5B6T3_9GAMM|nr:RusA family crossover junction endodeoxyribonuclease [Dickeya oryzae]MBP2856162.1 RusA family crossover junction endodeoxyribonuclease [Dickeya oryzae]
MKLTLPFPPSVNTYWRAPNKGPLVGRHLISQAGRRFVNSLIASVLEQLQRKPSTMTQNVSVTVIFYPPDRSRRDLDNYFKAVFDGLTHAGVWLDDKQVKRIVAEWGPITRPGKTEITITDHQGESA